jgi:integrase
MDYVCPVVRGMHRYDTSAHMRDRWLTDEEIKALWTACGDMGTFGSLVEMLLLTGQRRTKVQTMKWDDVVDAVWSIRSEKREKTTRVACACRNWRWTSLPLNRASRAIRTCSLGAATAPSMPLGAKDRTGRQVDVRVAVGAA